MYTILPLTGAWWRHTRWYPAVLRGPSFQELLSNLNQICLTVCFQGAFGNITLSHLYPGVLRGPSFKELLSNLNQICLTVCFQGAFGNITLSHLYPGVLRGPSFKELLSNLNQICLTVCFQGAFGNITLSHLYPGVLRGPSFKELLSNLNQICLTVCFQGAFGNITLSHLYPGVLRGPSFKELLSNLNQICLTVFFQGAFGNITLSHLWNELVREGEVTLGLSDSVINSGWIPCKERYDDHLLLTRSLREPGGPCTKSMDVSESRMERVNAVVTPSPKAILYEPRVTLAAFTLASKNPGFSYIPVFLLEVANLLGQLPLNSAKYPNQKTHLQSVDF